MVTNDSDWIDWRRDVARLEAEAAVPEVAGTARCADVSFSLGGGLSARIAKSERERAELVSLRTTAYRMAGKHLGSDLMADRFDDGAMLVGVWRGDVPIASSRVIARPPADEWEHDRFMQWESQWPARQHTAEISRFCITRQERNWWVVRALSYATAMALLATGRRYILACCTDELVPFYQRFYCARFTGVTIQHSDLGPKPHRVFFSDYQPGMLGSGISAVPWLALWPVPALVGLRHGALLQDATVSERALAYARCALGLLAMPVAVQLVALSRRRRRQSRDN